jgi:hypothetical protein
LIGLPESIDSRTANSRVRSWRMRAIRNRYFARSLPGRLPHRVLCARRAARMALSTSAVVARETSAMTSSVAGLTLLNTPPSAAWTSRPSMNRP